MPKESVPRNHKNNMKTGLRLKEIMPLAVNMCDCGDSDDWWNIFQDVYNCLLNSVNLVTSKNELVEKVFPNILTNYKNRKWLNERAILAAKNKDVHEINNIILTKIRDQAVIYKSVDTVLEPNESVNYPSKFLNSLDLPGFPLHALQLKIGVPIILLRNISPPKLWNGTRLVVKKRWKP